MVLDSPGTPLRLETEHETPRPGPGEVLIRVGACGVCRTDLHIVDGELPAPRLPLIPGHEIVGTVEDASADVEEHRIGDRVGVPWVGWTCGECAFCRSERENLCDRPRFTGYHLDGGYAGYVVADSRFTFSIPPGFADVPAAPLLCAGLIGYRALRLAGTGRRVGFYGFGAAAHLAVQLAKFREQEVYAFTRPGDRSGQEFARGLGAVWAGGSDERPPEPLDSALIFAPVGALVPAALAAITKGGVVVCAGIHMSELPSFSYELLRGERSVRSVANLTRQDAEEFFALVPEAKIRTTTRPYPLADANEALADLRTGRVHGAAVIVP
jgi:alcohol dehydrogenase, propanol-preferring